MITSRARDGHFVHSCFARIALRSAECANHPIVFAIVEEITKGESLGPDPSDSPKEQVAMATAVSSNTVSTNQKIDKSDDCVDLEILEEEEEEEEELNEN